MAPKFKSILKQNQEITPQESEKSFQLQSKQKKDVSKQKTSQDKDKDYEVEKILDKKMINGVGKYLIKWNGKVIDSNLLGYPRSQSTWEPKENLKNVLYMVEEFDKKLSKTTAEVQESDHDSSVLVSSKPKKQKNIISITQAKQLRQKTKDQSIEISADEQEIEKIAREEIVVESIVDSKMEKGKKVYLIKWKECETMTWEPEAKLSELKEMLREFEENQEKKIKSLLESRQFLDAQMHSESEQEVVVNTKIKKSKKPEERVVPIPAILNDKQIVLNVSNFEEKETLGKVAVPHNFRMPTDLVNYEEGSYHKGDKALKAKVLQMNTQKSNPFFKIEWASREDGTQPKDSVVSYNIVKMYDPYIILEYFEHKRVSSASG